MNKLLSLLLIATIAIAAIPYARGLGTPEAPPGVACVCKLARVLILTE